MATFSYFFPHKQVVSAFRLLLRHSSLPALLHDAITLSSDVVGKILPLDIVKLLVVGDGLCGEA